MTTFQKWLLVIAALISSVSIAYYLLVYIPTTKKAEIRKQAGVECTKRANEVVKALPPVQTQEQAASQAQLIIQLNSPESQNKCIEKVLNEWGY